MPNRFIRGIAFVVAVILLAVGTRAARAQDEIFTTNSGNNSVTVHARTATGNIAPIRTLVGGSTGLNSPAGLAVDLVNNELVVVNVGAPSVTVYTRTANGNALPTRTIAGGSTGFATPMGLALDLVNNELFVANLTGNSVTVYTRTANGNAAPTRTIAGGSTGLSNPIGLAVDTVNNELFVTNAADFVTVYSRTANGNVAPTRTLVGGSTGLSLPEGLAVDTVNNELLVVNGSNSGSGNSVTVYPRTANGNIAPTRKISGASTTFCGPEGLALDLVNDELAVANPNSCGNSVLVFARTANGNAIPLRALSGGTSGISSPGFVAITTGGTTAQPFTPTLSTVASPGGIVGVPISDSATLSGGGIASAAPTGSIIFTLFLGADCIFANTINSWSVPITGNGTYPSPSYTTLAPGTYHWDATYAGDANNAATKTTCNDASESVIVAAAKATPTLSTVASSPGVTLGAATFDTATLSGGINPTGQISFLLFGPNDPNCATDTNPSSLSLVPVSGNGTYTSLPFTPPSIGTYHWVAAYNGDGLNAKVFTACTDVSESVIVSAAGTAAAGIPTLSGWGLMTLMVLVVIASIYRLRRL